MAKRLQRRVRMASFMAGGILMMTLCSCGLSTTSKVVIVHKPLRGSATLVIYHKKRSFGTTLKLPIYVNGEQVPGKLKEGGYLTCHVPSGDCVVSTHAANRINLAYETKVNMISSGLGTGLIEGGIQGMLALGATGAVLAPSTKTDNEDRGRHKTDEDTLFQVGSGTYYVEIHSETFRDLLIATVRDSGAKGDVAQCRNMNP